GARTPDSHGPLCTEEIALLLTLLVGHGADEAITLDRGRDREADAGIAARRLDDRPARAEKSAALGVVDHQDPDPVLDRSAGVEVLELRDDGRAETLPDTAERHERRMADEREHVGRDRHRCESRVR